MKKPPQIEVVYMKNNVGYFINFSKMFDTTVWLDREGFEPPNKPPRLQRVISILAISSHNYVTCAKV